MLEKIGQDVSHGINPLLNAGKRGEPGESIIIDGVLVNIHPEFRLIITSELTAPRFSAAIGTVCNIINFVLCESALEA